MKTVIVTGASGAIGGAVAELLARQGYAAVLCYRTGEDRAQQLRQRILGFGGEALCMGGDLRLFEQARGVAERTVELYGRLDAVVAAAGESQRGLFVELTQQSWEEALGANLTSFAAISRAALPHMLRRQQGSILAIGSVWGRVGAAMEAPYSAAKAGVAGLVRALAKEYAPSGIRVNCLSPGAIDTPMNRFLTPAERQQLCGEIPLGRMGDPREVASLAAEMLQNPYLTGQEVTLDGGFTL